MPLNDHLSEPPRRRPARLTTPDRRDFGGLAPGQPIPIGGFIRGSLNRSLDGERGNGNGEAGEARSCRRGVEAARRRMGKTGTGEPGEVRAASKKEGQPVCRSRPSSRYATGRFMSSRRPPCRASGRR
jgi:hypothetical protein